MPAAAGGDAVYLQTATTGPGTIEVTAVAGGWKNLQQAFPNDGTRVSYAILNSSLVPIEWGYGLTDYGGSTDQLQRSDVVDPSGGAVTLSGSNFVIVTQLGEQVDGMPWQDVASAATTDIGNVKSPFVNVTGSATITGLGTPKQGYPLVWVKFAGDSASPQGFATLTHGASLILPGGDDIETALGDVAAFKHEGAGVWRCVGYERADGTAVVGATSGTLSKSAAYTVTTDDNGKTILANPTTSYTITLPAAATAGDGFQITVMRFDSGVGETITIDADGSETINGATTLVLRQPWAVATLKSYGTNWVVVSRSQLSAVLLFSSGIATIASGSTDYFGGTANEAGTKDLAQIPVPFAGRVRGLQIKTNGSPGAGQSFTYTLMLNGSAVAITATMSDSATTASDTSNKVTVAAGDLLEIRCVTSGSAAARFHRATLIVEEF